MPVFAQAFCLSRAALIGLLATIMLPEKAKALDDAEQARLLRCAKDICNVFVSRKAEGPDIDCDLSKSFDKDQIQKSAESKHLSWGFGSARCRARITAKRADLIAAISASETTLKFTKQPFSCEIGTEKYEISATVAPELKFKSGSATAVSLNLENIQGTPLIKGAVWTAATLDRTFGILQKDLVREANRFMNKECPKILGAAK